MFLVILSSVFSENVAHLKSSMIAAAQASDSSMMSRIQAILSGELGIVVLSVLLLHFGGFLVG